MLRAIVFASLLVAVPALGQAHEVEAGSLRIEHPHMRASMGMSPTTAGYLVIENAGKADDRLVSASCACAKMVMIHKTEIKNAMASMKSLDGITIPVGGKAVLAPGATHLMIMGLKAPIKAGAMVEMTLTFAKAGAVKVPFKVVDQTGEHAEMDHSGH